MIIDDAKSALPVTLTHCVSPDAHMSQCIYFFFGVQAILRVWI